MKTIFVLLALFVGAANAQTFGLHLVSGHAHGGYNNVNPGVYVRLDNGATLGTFRNSHSRQSVYAGYTVEKSWNGFSAALTVGGITGYKEASVMVLAVPSVAYSGVRLGIIPRPMKGGSAALHLMVEKHY